MSLQRILALALCVALLPWPAAATEPDQITLFIPAFDGPGALGRNVATVVNLRIWSTLRRKPWPNNPNNLDFGRGLIVWSPEPLSSASYAEAERQVRSPDILGQLCLWGKATHYGDGVVVQTNLSIPDYQDFRTQHNERWTLQLNGQTITADLPRRRLEMPSIVLRHDIIAHYSQPSALQIFAARQGGEPIGVVGSSFRGLQFERGQGLAKVQAGSVTGWVRLPQLSHVPTALPSFVGGIIKVFRGDWQGVSSEMNRVLETPDIRTPLRIDAHLYAGLALEKTGRSGQQHFAQALALNPYAKRSIRYLVMGELAAWQRLAEQGDSAAARQSLREQLQATLNSKQALFPSDDPWFSQAQAIVAHL